MSDDDCEGLVMACRASRLNWQTTLAILSNRSGARLSFAERERAQRIFETLLSVDQPMDSAMGGNRSKRQHERSGKSRRENGG